MNNTEQAKEMLKKYNQEHIIHFLEQLEGRQQEELINQVLEINFPQIINLYEKTKQEEVIEENNIDFIPYIDKSKLEEEAKTQYEQIGADLIRQRKICLCHNGGRAGNKTWV